MSYRHWALAIGLGCITLVVGLASASALRPRAALNIEGQLDAGAQKSPPKPVAQLKPEAVRAEEAALRKANKAFSDAYNKGDLDALMALWAEDAEYIGETGKSYRGKEPIKALLKKSLATNKGSKQSIKVHSVRFLKPDVALEEGTVLVTGADGADSPGRYSAVYLKQGGQWLLSSVRDLPTPDEEDKPNSYNRLKSLSWMTGEWVDKQTGKAITITCRWAGNQAYLMQEINAQEADGKDLRMVHLITWDPLNEQVRSWLFDATGGVSEGVWEREGNTWVVTSEGWFGDGRAAQATIRWQFVDADTINWSSVDRQADEQPLPDLKITFVRKAKGKDR